MSLDRRIVLAFTHAETVIADRGMRDASLSATLT